MNTAKREMGNGRTKEIKEREIHINGKKEKKVYEPRNIPSIIDALSDFIGIHDVLPIFLCLRLVKVSLAINF